MTIKQKKKIKHTFKQDTKGKKGRRGKTRKRNRSGSFWLRFFKFLGFFVLAGLLLLYWDSARLSAIISNASLVNQVTPDTHGIIRLEGTAEGIPTVTDEGKLRNRYALLQKDRFQWGCSKSACSYKWSEDRQPNVWGSFMIDGVNVQSEWFRFYSNWLPLDFTTVEQEQWSNIYEGGSSRPLLVESPKKTAFGYHTVTPGEQITVIGRARNGRLEPFALPGKGEQSVILIGTNIERMLSAERKTQIGYAVVSGIVILMLLPTIIGWIRKLIRRIQKC